MPAVALPTLLHVLLSLCACQDNPSPRGLEIIIATSGLQLGVDLDAIEARVSQETLPGTWHPLFDVTHRVPSEVALPTTLAIAPGASPDQDALIEITGLKSGVPVVRRVVQTQVPLDRAAELVMILANDCLDKITLCAPASCQPQTGMCGSNLVAPSTLPTYQPGDEGRLDAGSWVANAEAGGSGDATLGADGSHALSEGGDGSPQVVSDATADAVNDAPSNLDAGGGAVEAGNARSGPVLSAGCGRTPRAADLTGLILNSIPVPGVASEYLEGGAYAESNGPYDFAYRPYVVKLPASYDFNRPYPVTLGAGGCGGGAVALANSPSLQLNVVPAPTTGTQSEAIQVGLTYVSTCFADSSGGFGNGTDSPEIAYVKAVLADIETQFCVDESRVFMSGYESGADESLMMGCALGGVVRAISIADGQLRVSRPPCTGPVAALIVAGEANTIEPIGPLDPTNPSEIGRVRGLGTCGTAVARDSILKRNGCDPSQGTTPWDPQYPACVAYKCPLAYPVVWCPLPGLGEHQTTLMGVNYLPGNVPGDPLMWSFLSKLAEAPADAGPGANDPPPVCAPGATSCSGSQLQICDCSGHWGATQPCAIAGESCQNQGMDTFPSCQCSALELECSGSCVDPSKDSNNCGGCGVLESSSDIGRCPTVLASWLESAGSIAVSADHVYWIDSAAHNVVSVSVGGGTPKVVAGSAQTWPLAIDRTFAYWLDDVTGDIDQVPLAGGTTVSLIHPTYNAADIVSDGSYVYWTMDGAVMKVPVAGGAPELVASDPNGPSTIAVDANDVYWYSSSAVTGTGTLNKVARSGGQAATLVSGVTGLFGLAADTIGGIYWAPSTNGGGGTGDVMWLAPGSTQPTLIASGQTNIVALAADQSGVYWATSLGAIRTVPTGAASSITLATGQDVQGLGLGATALFWAGSFVQSSGEGLVALMSLGH